MAGPIIADVTLGAKPSDLTFDNTADVIFQNQFGTGTGGTTEAGFFDSNANGTVFTWHSEGPANTSPASPNGATQFFAVGHGDYNGNGSDDILYQNSRTGEIGYNDHLITTQGGWQSLGLGPTPPGGVLDVSGGGFSAQNPNPSPNPPGPGGLNWIVLDTEGHSDFKGEGHDDILFYNTAAYTDAGGTHPLGELFYWDPGPGGSKTFESFGSPHAFGQALHPVAGGVPPTQFPANGIVEGQTGGSGSPV